MSMRPDCLQNERRILIQADLCPVQGQRFQPTGFPDLGAATYRLPDNTEMLLVESAQSMANRLENTIWDPDRQNLLPFLRGMPYVSVRTKSRPDVELTNSILEAHRINSPYILDSGDNSLMSQLTKEFGTAENDVQAIDNRKVASIVFKYDPNSILHGLFVSRKELAGGRLRLPRAVSSFIEARGALPAESGGVKNDRVNPKGDTAAGYGNVPYSRTEYVAKNITAYFNIDLAVLSGYRLGDNATQLLIDLALWKVCAFLHGNLRLRTACDLESTSVVVTRPKDFMLPNQGELEREITYLINTCKEQFAEPPVTIVEWDSASAKSKKDEPEAKVE